MSRYKFYCYTSTNQTSWSRLLDYVRAGVREKLPDFQYYDFNAYEERGIAETMGSDGGWHEMEFSFNGEEGKGHVFREAVLAGIAAYKRSNGDPILLDGPHGKVTVDDNPLALSDVLIVET